MALSSDIVEKIDTAKELLSKAYDELNPENYSISYEKVWFARAEIEFVVIALKLLNNLEKETLNNKWKEEFGKTLKQVRSESKIRQAFDDTFGLFQKLEDIDDIIEFYKICWMLKEKITILLNVVKPKHKLKKENVKTDSN
ncbi:MAG: hypothetical protein HZR80_20700 [Candidatus Heimdallarchaeota archaeon]